MLKFNTTMAWTKIACYSSQMPKFISIDITFKHLTCFLSLATSGSLSDFSTYN